MNILYDLGLIASMIDAWLVVLSFAIVSTNIVLALYSSFYILLLLGPLFFILWLFTRRENIFRDKPLRKILKYISYTYPILTILAILPYLYNLSLKVILYTLEGCAIGYVNVILDAIILYYICKKMYQFYITIKPKATNTS